MLTRESIREAEAAENRHHQRVHATFSTRRESARAWQEWEEATSAWHACRHPVDNLWSDAFLQDLRNSKRQAIEDAILYLEVDPWYFRSGYLKERLIRGIRKAILREEDKRRLRAVVWNAASGRNRREYRRYCSLAALVGDADLIRLLEEISPERDRIAKGKFRYLLDYLRRHNASNG